MGNWNLINHAGLSKKEKKKEFTEIIAQYS